MGREAFEGFRFLASFDPPGTGRTEGPEKTQPFKRIHSRVFTYSYLKQAGQSAGDVLDLNIRVR